MIIVTILNRIKLKSDFLELEKEISDNITFLDDCETNIADKLLSTHFFAYIPNFGVIRSFSGLIVSRHRKNILGVFPL